MLRSERSSCRCERRPRLAEVLPTAAVTEAHGVVTADVDRERWVEAVTAVRDDEVLDGTFFDHLLVVDQLPDGFDVLVRLWSVARRHGVHLRTSCPRDDATVPSLAGVFAGATWHERHAAEMFGVAFAGSPDDRPLLLPPGGVPHPLRKEHVAGRAGGGAVARRRGPGLPRRGRPAARAAAAASARGAT